MPKKIEWIVNSIAEATPKINIVFLYLFSGSIKEIIFLLYIQYFISRKEVINIAGLNTKYVGKTLAVLLIEAPPSK